MAVDKSIIQRGGDNECMYSVHKTAIRPDRKRNRNTILATMKTALALLVVSISLAHGARYSLLRIGSPSAGTTESGASSIQNYRSLFEEDSHVYVDPSIGVVLRLRPT